MATIARNTIFTNVALTPDGGVWWEGHDRRAAGRVPRLAGRALDAGDRPDDRRSRPRIPNARFTAPASQCPIIDSDWESPGRRADQRDHLRRPPRDDDAAGLSGVQLDARASTSARRWGRRRPPPRPAASARCAAIRWRCCRSAATTWATTSGTGSRCSALLSETPRIFHVNWFRKDADGHFLWPGFRENMRVLKWIVDRVRGRVLGARRRRSAGCRATRTSTGRGLDVPEEQFDELQARRSGAVAARSDRARGAVHRSARSPAAGDDLRARAADLPVVRRVVDRSSE